MIAVRRAGLLLGVLCIAAAASDISLAESLQQNGEEWLKVRANSYVRAKKTVAQIQKNLMHFYKRTDIDGGGISYSDHRLKEQKESIRQRSRHLTNWLNRDLDGNGVVTREELERAIDQYGRTLVGIPSNGLEEADVFPSNVDPRQIAVDVPLWTREEGRSDLTLSVTIVETDGTASVSMDDLHVL